MTVSPAGPMSLSRPGSARGAAAPRLLIAGATLVSIGWVITLAVVRPASFWLEATLRFVPVLLALSAVAAFVVAMSGMTRRGGFLAATGAGFTVPPSRAAGWAVLGQVLLAGLLGGEAVRQSTASFSGGADFGVLGHAYGVVMSVLSIIIGCLTVPVVVVALVRRPRTDLTPTALVIGGALGSRVVPWESLRPAQPVTITNAWTLSLNVDQPQLIIRRGITTGAARIVVLRAPVDGPFLAAVIGFYVQHPHRRGAIGTTGEYQRLLADLGVAGEGRRRW